MTESEKTSVDSMIEASRDRAQFSGHGNALGAAGEREACTTSDSSIYLRNPGECLAVNPPEGGFKAINIAVAWDNVKAQKSGILGKFLKKTMHVGVDLDLGCLYELTDGTRGAIQAFGKKFGHFDVPPYMRLSGDERTGDAKNIDEIIHVNGLRWDKIKRILVYLYIYDGAPRWSQVQPRIEIDVPGREDLIVTLGNHNDRLALCAIGELENVRSGIKLTNHTEYFAGHEEMDRAFGFGLTWNEGKK